MSSEEQALAYQKEARLTLESARSIFDTAASGNEQLWAQVVKNAYDAIEQAVSAAIAATGESVPRTHPAKVNTFLALCDPADDLESLLLYWLRRRSNSQYVDIRGDEINVPHQQFDRGDAERVLEDAENVLGHVEDLLDTASR